MTTSYHNCSGCGEKEECDAVYKGTTCQIHQSEGGGRGPDSRAGQVGTSCVAVGIVGSEL